MKQAAVDDAFFVPGVCRRLLQHWSERRCRSHCVQRALQRRRMQLCGVSRKSSYTSVASRCICSCRKIFLYPEIEKLIQKMWLKLSDLVFLIFFHNFNGSSISQIFFSANIGTKLHKGKEKNESLTVEKRNDICRSIIDDIAQSLERMESLTTSRNKPSWRWAGISNR